MARPLFTLLFSDGCPFLRLSTPNVIVVGVDHFLQNLENVCVTPEGHESEALQRAALKARLEELILQHRPQLIGEEEKPGTDSIGKLLANAHRLNYCTLTMPWEERHKFGINKDYNNTRETRRAAYEVFESFMFEQIQNARGDATCILVICGSYHAERLATLLTKAGLDADFEDTYYADWYRGRPMEDAERIIGFDKERPMV